jgi:hypothetical protein
VNATEPWPTDSMTTAVTRGEQLRLPSVTPRPRSL